MHEPPMENASRRCYDVHTDSLRITRWFFVCKHDGLRATKRTWRVAAMPRTLDGIFDAKIAIRGGMVRRSIKSLKANDCYEKLLSMARDRCFPVFAIGDQVVVVCTPAPDIRRLA